MFFLWNGSFRPVAGYIGVWLKSWEGGLHGTLCPIRLYSAAPVRVSALQNDPYPLRRSIYDKNLYNGWTTSRSGSWCRFYPNISGRRVMCDRSIRLSIHFLFINASGKKGEGARRARRARGANEPLDLDLIQKSPNRQPLAHHLIPKYNFDDKTDPNLHCN